MPMWGHRCLVAPFVALATLQSLWFSTSFFLRLPHQHISLEIPTNSNTANTLCKLRFDWTRLEILDPLAKRVYDHQRNCNLGLANFRYRNRFGLGSDLHLWSQAMCNALEDGSYRIRTLSPWIWNDETACRGRSPASSMLCYFPASELACPNDTALIAAAATDPRLMRNITRGRGRISNECPSTITAAGGVSTVRTATTVYLWSRMSPLVQAEAERQLRKVFPRGKPPPGLITVHIRWGDKADEMTLAPIGAYVDAVHSIIQERGPLDSSSRAHIYLATEDPRAVEEFKDAAPASWTVYIDAYYSEMLPNRNSDYNGNPQMARTLAGRPGLVALGSLLVAMEADAFVLTTASNWSRLMNELRKGVLDPRCNNCTRMIDLIPGES